MDIYKNKDDIINMIAAFTDYDKAYGKLLIVNHPKYEVLAISNLGEDNYHVYNYKQGFGKILNFEKLFVSFFDVVDSNVSSIEEFVEKNTLILLDANIIDDLVQTLFIRAMNDEVFDQHEIIACLGLFGEIYKDTGLYMAYSMLTDDSNRSSKKKGIKIPSALFKYKTTVAKELREYLSGKVYQKDYVKTATSQYMHNHVALTLKAIKELENNHA